VFEPLELCQKAKKTQVPAQELSYTHVRMRSLEKLLYTLQARFSTPKKDPLEKRKPEGNLLEPRRAHWPTGPSFRGFLRIFLGISLLSSASLAAPTKAPESLSIRVLIGSGSRLELTVPFAHNLYYPDGRLLFKSDTALAWPLGITSSGTISLNGSDSGSSKIYIPDGGPNTTMSLGGSSYRGGMWVRVQGGTLQAINIVGIEDYLRSVVPSEMPPSWSLEALKAQAVIARTYAISKLNPKSDYDICATQQCQVYTGTLKEHSGSDLAVAQTAGYIVAWNNKPALTYFSSDNGGWIASANEVWGMNVPYLVAQADPFSKSPKSAWQLEFTWANASRIASGYAKVGTLSSVVVGKYSNSGRPLEITLTGSAGKATLKEPSASNFVKALGAYSTRVAFGGNDKSMVMAGAGFGHGVGLSQYGASGMAVAGYDYLSIMGFYFPKAQIAQYTLAGSGLNTQNIANLPQFENSSEMIANSSLIYAINHPSTETHSSWNYGLGLDPFAS
jgi:stage II sporulation protein D